MSAPTREQFIAVQRRFANVSEAEAVRRWEEHCAKQRPIAAVPSEPEDDAALEKSTQWEVVKAFRALGGRVYSLSQSRATKQTPGLPDLWVFFPAHRIACWWETKRPKGGRYSEAQQEFAAFCELTGVRWGGGSRADAEAWLIAQRIAYRASDGSLEPVRRPRSTRSA